MTQESSRVDQTKRRKKKRGLSIAIYPLSLGGSNAERLEIEAIFAPPYNAASYGLSLTSSPYQADVILLYGSLTEKIGPLVYNLLGTLPSNVKLIALGSEALTNAPFANAYAVAGPLLDTNISEQPYKSSADKIAANEQAITLVEPNTNSLDQVTESGEQTSEVIQAEALEDSEISATELEIDDERVSETAENVEPESEISESAEVESEQSEIAKTDNAEEAENNAEVEPATSQPITNESETISEAEIRVIDESETVAEAENKVAAALEAEILARNESKAKIFTPQIQRKGVPLPANLHLAGYIAGSPPDPQAILDGILIIMTAN